MGSLNQKDIKFYLDNASASLTDISAYTFTQELDRLIQQQEDTGEGLQERTFINGLGSGTIRVGGVVNSTTDAIFGPLVASVTSLTKTFAYRESSSRFYKGETNPSNVKYSGSRDTLQLWSVDLTVTGAFTRTSVLGT